MHPTFIVIGKFCTTNLTIFVGAAQFKELNEAVKLRGKMKNNLPSYDIF